MYVISFAVAVLTCTHNLYFGSVSVLRTILYAFIPQFHYAKEGFKSVYITRTCYPGVTNSLIRLLT